MLLYDPLFLNVIQFFCITWADMNKVTCYKMFRGHTA